MKRLKNEDFLDGIIEQKEDTEETERIFVNKEGYKFDIILDVIQVHTEQEINSAEYHAVTGLSTEKNSERGN